MSHVPKIKSNPNDASTWLPLHTDKLTPAVFTEVMSVSYRHMNSPICVVGSGPLSKEWITRIKPYLVKQHAICWMVEAPNIKAYSTIHHLMDGVLLLPADGDAIALFFKIDHYPVIINEREIAQ